LSYDFPCGSGKLSAITGGSTPPVMRGDGSSTRWPLKGRT